MQKELLQLFEGDSSQYLSISLTGEMDERGKRKASYSTIHEPVTEELWKNHVDGKHLIGIRPENGDKLKWSCIDIDPANYKQYIQKYVDIIRDFELPLVPVKSNLVVYIYLYFFLIGQTKIRSKKN